MEEKILILSNITKEISQKCFDSSLTPDKTKKFPNMFIEDIIDYLIVTISDYQERGLLSNSDENTYFEKIAELNIYNYDSISKIHDRLAWLKEMNLTRTPIGLKESHILILKIFDEINCIMNTFAIDYYHTGGILAYLLTGHKLERYHHDLDIFVNEVDIPKLEYATRNSNFRYEMFLGKKADNTRRRVVKLHYKSVDIPISIFIFERLDNGAVIVNDYFFDKNNNLFTVQDYNSPHCVELSFSDKWHIHNNIPYKAITIEALYNCKKGSRPKDLYDAKIMEPFVDRKIEMEIAREIISNSEAFEVKDEKIKKSMTRLLK